MITRQEAAVILTTILHIDPSSLQQNVEKFKDDSTISDWSKSSIATLAYKGIIDGYEDGTFRPNQFITRAEAVVTIDRVKNAQVVMYGKEGLYGPSNGLETIQGDVVISVPGVNLQNVIINGDLLLDKGIGQGDVYLNNVTVKGTTTVMGGGENSVHIKNSILVNVVVNKKDGSVRIVVEGNTQIHTILLESSAIIEHSLDNDEVISKVNLSKELPENSRVTLIGKFDTVDIAANNLEIEISSGLIGELRLIKGVEGTIVNLSQNSSIVNMVLDAIVKVFGDGLIKKAILNKGAGGSQFEHRPDSIDGVEKDSIQETKPVFGGGGVTVNPTPQKSAAPASVMINTYNYFSGNDELRYGGVLPVGSTLKVYDAATGGSVIGNSETNKVMISDGFSSVISNVYVTLTESGKLESERVTQKISSSYPISPSAQDFHIRNYREGEDRIIHYNLPPGLLVNFYDASGNKIETTTSTNNIYSSLFNVKNGFNTVSTSLYAAYTVTEDTYAYSESKRTELQITPEIDRINAIVGTDLLYSIDHFGNYVEFLAAASSNYSVVRAHITNGILTISSIKQGYASVNIVVRKENGEAVLIVFDVDVFTAP